MAKLIYILIMKLKPSTNPIDPDNPTMQDIAVVPMQNVADSTDKSKYGRRILTIPLVASYLNEGYKPMDIHRALNVSHGCVNQFIKRNIDKLEPLLNDKLMSMKFKGIALQGIEKINEIFNKSTFDKRDLVSLSTITGISIDKSRVLNNQPTEISRNEQLIIDVKEMIKHIKETV